MRVIMSETEIKEHKADKEYHDNFMIIRESAAYELPRALNVKATKPYNATKRSNSKK
jgi:hypothetical protein